MVNHLDRNLFIGGEVKEVYDELIKTIDEDYLKFDLVILKTIKIGLLILYFKIRAFKDDYIQNAPLKLNYESSYTSSLLKKFGRSKSINNKLLLDSKTIAPWGNMDIRDWNKT